MTFQIIGGDFATTRARGAAMSGAATGPDRVARHRRRDDRQAAHSAGAHSAGRVC